MVAVRNALHELKRRPSTECQVRFVYIKGTIMISTSYERRFDDCGTPWQDIYNDFFDIISPTVEVLTVDAEPHWIHRTRGMFPSSTHLSFPRLTSLTASSTVLQFLTWNNASPPAADMPTRVNIDQLPALKHLHLFLDTNNRSRSDDPYYRTILQQTPRLSHLRISDVFDDPPLALSIGSMIGIPEYVTLLVDITIELNPMLQGLQNELTEDIANPIPIVESLRNDLEAHRLHHLCALVFDHSSIKIKPLRYTSMANKITPLIIKYQGYQQIRMAYFRSSPSATSGGLLRAWEDVISGGLGAWDMECVSRDLIYSAPPSELDGQVAIPC
jgi:hypothetical protein